MSDAQQVKAKVDIVQLIGETVPLKKAGRTFKGLCPFHQEKTPSFIVSPERQTYHCFGCGEGGDVFEFVMKRERVDFPEALRMLATRAGVELRGFDSKAHKAKQRLFEANEQAAKYFRAALQHHAGKIAADYLAARGITEPTAEQFQIGYAPDDYDAMVAALQKKGVTAKELIDAGLAIPGKRGPYARFRGRLMIPLADSSGAIRGFTGRVLTKEASGGKYVNTPETAIYHKSELVFGLHLAKQAIIAQEAAVLVEGQMDVISAHQAGTPNVVAASGTAFTEGHLSQVTRYAATIILAFDTDAAGRQALLRIVELVGQREIELQVVDLGDAKDPDELISQNPQAWQEAVNQAVPVIDFLLARSLAEHRQPYSRAAINQVLKAVLPVLRYRPSLDQDYYLEQLATTLGLEKATIKERLSQSSAAAPPAAGSTANPPTKTEVATPSELVAQRLLGLVMTTPALQPKLDLLDHRLFPESYQGAAVAAKSEYNKETVSDADRALLDVSALAAAEYEPMTEPERAAEFDRLTTRLKQLWVRQHQPKLLAAIKRAEESGDRSRRNQLMEEYTTLTKRITHG